jgi:hypothetical protein
MVGRGTPVDVARAWFAAIDSKNRTATTAAFLPADRDQVDWDRGNPADWSTFTSVACKQQSEQAARATVLCIFSESMSSSEGNPDTFWSIDMQQQSDGRWLITGYGQG